MDKYDAQELLRRHVRNLSKMHASHKGESLQYDYIISADELRERMFNHYDDLGYPLRVEPKRDRYVLNSEGFEKALQQACRDALNEMEKEVYQWMKNDCKYKIQEVAVNALNSVVPTEDGFIAKKPTKEERWAIKLGDRFGKALAKMIQTAFDEITGR